MPNLHLLTAADLQDLEPGHRADPITAPLKCLSGHALATRCTPDLTAIDRMELATEREGNDARAIVAAITGLLDGLALRCEGDETALAAILAIRDWHLPDLRGLATH
ncbi:hypothetical protein [Inhella sp.]|uniref:hypothetical protein n=1 Tax=Inhella sp. TaxID=1921806 RepID=UPI0035AECF0C